MGEALPVGRVLSDGLALALADVLALWPDCVVGVAVEPLASKARAAFHGDEVFHPASTIKVTLLAALYHEVAAGRLSLDEKMTIHNGFPSSIDGSLFDLSADDDSDGTLYKRMGEQETLRELARLMTVRSSNLGTNLLLEKVPPATISAYVKKVRGAEGLLFRNRMYDMKAFDARQTNRATATGLTSLAAAIGRKEVAGADELLEVLRHQEFKSGIPAGVLASGVAGAEKVTVAHKTGSITGHSHDFGIVYPADEKAAYAMTILTRGTKSDDEGHKLVAQLASETHKLMMR